MARSASKPDWLSLGCFVQGLIFTVACDKGLMRLYDCRNYQIGPFQTFLVCQSPKSEKALPGPLALHVNVCCDVAPSQKSDDLAEVAWTL